MSNIKSMQKWKCEKYKQTNQNRWLSNERRRKKTQNKYQKQIPKLQRQKYKEMCLRWDDWELHSKVIQHKWTKDVEKDVCHYVEMRNDKNK